MKRRFLTVRVLAAIAAWLGGANAHAGAPALESEPATEVRAESTASGDAGAAPAAGEGAEASAATFDVLELRVVGNTLLPAKDIERVVYPFLGPGRSMRDVEAARDALGALYRERGYGTANVDVPEQDVVDGVVRLAVTEGTLGRLRVTGAKYYSGRAIRSALPALQPGTTPRLPELQERLVALARQSPGRQITPVLKSGARPGTFDLDLRVKDELPLKTTLEVNDRYTADTSRTRASAGVSYDNLWQRGHSLSLQYQFSPEEPSEVSVWALTYVGRSLATPNVWVLYAVDSNSDVAALGTLSVIGKGRIFGGRYIIPTVSSAERQASWSLGVDYKDFLENVRTATVADGRTPISYAVWSAGYSDSRVTQRFTLGGTLGLALGQRGLGNSSSEFAFKRFRGTPNFVALRGSGSLSMNVLGNGFARVRSAFQYSPQPLVSNEQFNLGGVDSVRGYLDAESLTDIGVTGSAEIGAAWWRDPARPAAALEAFAFFDAGVGGVQSPLPSQTTRFDLSSWGVGLHLTRPAWLDARVDWARPLVPGPRTAAGDSRWHFALRVSF